ncbi:MAG: hypothetical protein GY857_04665 [Desulfobacula sp.]|nr:hypothetical protein [Desulfobacula sp.]
MRYAFGDLLPDISKPFVIGIIIAGIISFFFPEDLTVWANQHQFLSMLMMLAAGIPMYVCATSSTPIVAALIIKGLNPGAALIFLLAGPATNVATINVVKNIFNTRALIIYLSMITICSLAMGFFVDWLYLFMDIEAKAVVGQASEIIPHELQLASAIILSLLMAWNLVGDLFKKKQLETMA